MHRRMKDGRLMLVQIRALKLWESLGFFKPVSSIYRLYALH